MVNSTSGTRTSASFSPAVGDFLFVLGFGSVFPVTATTPAVTDSLGSTWTQRALANNSNPGGAGQGGAVSMYTFVATSTTSRTVTVTVSPGTADGAGVAVYKATGTGTIRLGASNKGSPNAGTTSFNGTLTTTASNSTIVAAASEWTDTGGFTLSSSDQTSFQFFSNTSFNGCAGVKQSVGAAGAKTVNFTGSSGTGQWYWILFELFESAITPTGSVSATGVMTKNVTKIPFTGSVTAAGVVTLLKVVVRVFTASVTATGAFIKRAQKVLTGSITPVGGGYKIIQKLPFTGSVTPTGAFRKAYVKLFAGSVTAVGTFASTFLGRVFGRPGITRVTVNRAAKAIIRIRRT